jgi:hypothetical protein
MMNAPEHRQTLEDIYKSSTDTAVKRAVVRSLMIGRDAAGLVALARLEKSPDMKREIVMHLSAMKTKEATDYLLELLK